MTDTDETLLNQLRQTDAHEAWRLFYDKYWAAILRYGRKLGLNAGEAQEVLQETMVALMRVLPDFSYDRARGRFRNFLLTIVHRRSMAAIARTRRYRRDHQTLEQDQESAPATPAAPADEPDETALRRWQESLAEDTMVKLLQDPGLDERTVAIFRAYVVEGRPAKSVAQEFGLAENTVYQIKNRLIRRLQTKVARRLRDEQGGAAGLPT